MADESAEIATFSLPQCERCGKRPATTSLVFLYRGEEYLNHFYCEPCSESAWDEAVASVDAKAAELKARGL